MAATMIDDADLSFRPLSGTYISQFATEIVEESKKKSFPSPVGDLYFSIDDSASSEQL